MTENLITSVNVVEPLFLIVVLGYLLKRWGVTDEGFNRIATKLCFNLILPISIFNSIVSAGVRDALKGRMLLWMLLIFLGVAAVSLVLILLFARDPKKRGVLLPCAVRSNFVYIGIPICENLFGESGVSVASVAIPFVVVVFNASAVIILSVFSGGEKKIRFGKLLLNIVRNPLIIGSLIGVVWSLAGIPVPAFIGNTLTTLAKTATPLALLALGGGFEFKAVKSRLRYILFGTAMRNLIVPFLALAAAVALGFRHEELAVFFVAFASPVAISSYPMAVQMNGDGELAGQLVVFTTTFSLFTMFLGIFILKTFGWL